jgi:D-alanyl-D-alanine carboxypeptidase
MKQFFTVVFGGLLAIAIGITISYEGSKLWKVIRPKIISSSFSTTFSRVFHLSKTDDVSLDGTTISRFARTIRYSADEEEDLISSAAATLPPSPSGQITAGAYLLKNISTGEYLSSRNVDQILPVASLSKLVTAIVARKVINADEKITIGRSIMSTYGNTAQFQVGETFVAKDLYYPLLMVSSNDAAEALAQAYDRKKFIQLMNDFAQSIGAYRTYFIDPSGLSPQNISTVDDLAIIVEWIRKYDPNILELTSEKSIMVRGHTWVNPTHFLNWSAYVGGKNGYTPEANKTGVALFNLGSKKDTYAVIVLGSELRDQDVVTLLERTR